MLEVVCSSGVVGLMGCLTENCEPNDKEGRRERRGVGSLGLALLLIMVRIKVPWIKTEVGRHISSQRSHRTKKVRSVPRLI
jgi:hypothetical protein